MFSPRDYEFISNNVSIKVRPTYLPNLSSASKNKFVYSYKITISNLNSFNVTLLERCWNVVENDGFTNVVSGEGVIGLQPNIKPGGTFDYSSQAIIYSKTGIMFGKYLFLNHKTDEKFEVTIPAFPLDQEGEIVIFN